MDVGRKIGQLWKSAAEEAGGIEHLTEVLCRLALFVSGGWILAIAFADWARSPSFATPGLTVAILLDFALGVINVAASVQVWIPARRIALLVPLSIIYLVTVHYWVFTLVVPFYGTDGMAFDHYSALLVLHGQNPYTADLAPALDLFRIPPFYVTPTETGSIVTKQPYPALSFLMYTPLVAAGIGDMRIVSLGAHVVAVLVVYRMAPQPLKAFAPLTLAFPDQLDFTGGSVQDILWVTPILLTIFLLDRRRVSGSLFGIACSLKPVPWLLAPFLFVYMWKRDRTRFPTSRGLWTFIAFAVGWFFLFNGPFILWNPAAWASAVFDPLIGKYIPLGPGLSILTQSAWVPLPAGFYLVALASVALSLLLVEFIDYPRARYLVWWFPGIMMFFAYRSLQNYFIYWYPLVFFSLSVWFRERCRSEACASTA